MSPVRKRLLISGQVQGVGFRPHVYRTAARLGLTGWVQNNASGVLIEIQGTSAEQFLAQLMADLPPLAKVRGIDEKTISPNVSETTFNIIKSESGTVKTIISPDTCICADCLRELSDPSSRYFRYPFLNCTHCGPRFTITENLPYDRSQTSMKDFPLCAKCYQEYTDPHNRRYHAQPTACAACGPRLSESVERIAEYIRAGEIVALKGAGGYQLICDAKNNETVLRLRERKNREAKPFALMVATLEEARTIVAISEPAETLLTGIERPIVLLPKLDKTLMPAVAPGLNEFGVMLPSTPLHYLLFSLLPGAILVVTSANPGGDPLVTDEAEAQNKLAGIAERIVSYNRKITSRADDSVVRVINEAPYFIRRARGYVPASVKLPHAIPSTLALGAHLKTTFCLTRDDEAFVSQHIGSLNNAATIEFFNETLAHFISFLDIKPERVACDLHPDFYTTRLAHEYGIPAFAIQHHHAHLASVAAEHQILAPALGLALDGYGYGTNGGSWGGELLLLDNTSFKRLGCFYPLPQPGGDIAALEPWRMAAAILHVLGRGDEIPIRFQQYPHARLVPELLAKQVNTPLSSSCGRLFDAASALLGLNNISLYEGQAAMALESLVTMPESLTGGFSIEGEYFNMLPTLARLSESDPVGGANLFHGTLIAGLTEWISAWAERIPTNMVLLSGGCFLNKMLTEGLTRRLSKRGLKPLLPRQLPPNDGGLSLGQAWIAGRI